MSRSTTFNGITRFIPGGITRVNANALAQVSLSTNGIIALLGEADEGEPGTIIQIDDPALAKETFRSGPLADAVRLAFQPSTDPRVPGGAFRCLCYKTNASTQGTRSLPSVVVTDSVAAGSTATVINFTTAGLTVDAFIGGTLRYAGSTRTITDNDASSVTVGSALPLTPLTGQKVEILDNQLTATTDAYGQPANETTIQVEQGVAANSLVLSLAKDGKTETSPDLGGTSFLDVVYEGVLVEAIPRTGALNGAPSPTVLTTATATAADDEQFIRLTSGTYANTLHRITSVSVGVSVTLQTALGGSPGSGDTYEIRNGIILSGGTGAAAGVVVSATDNTIQWTVGSTSVGANDLNGLVIEITGGTGAGQRRIIISNTNDTATVNDNWITNPDATSTFDIHYIEQADGLFAGSLGVCTTFQTLIRTNGATTPSTGLNLAITSTETLRSLAARISAVDGYTATVGDGVNPDTTLASWFDFGTRNRYVELRVDRRGALDTAFADTVLIDRVASSSTSGNTQTLGTTDNTTLGTTAYVGGTVRIGNETRVIQSHTANSVTVTPAFVTYGGTLNYAMEIRQTYLSFRQDLKALDDWLDNFSERASGTRVATNPTGRVTDATLGSEPPEVTSGALYFSGGGRGTSANSNFQAGFDALLLVRANHVVPLITQDLSNEPNGGTATFASVAAQLGDHVLTAAGAGRTERGGYLGLKGTKAALLAQGAALNNADVALTGQRFQYLDVDGNLVSEDDAPEWTGAVIAAGMRSGVPEVGEPLTFKFIKSGGVAQDATWDPNDTTDANALIQGGIMFAQSVEGRGIRWVRDITTWIVDDNLAFFTGSTRDVIRYVAYNLRTTLEDRFTGLKASPATVASVKEVAAATLQLYRQNNIIVDSVVDGALVLAFHNLRVTISGNVLSLKVGIFPAVGIDFELTDIFLQLPTVS